MVEILFTVSVDGTKLPGVEFKTLEGAYQFARQNGYKRVRIDWPNPHGQYVTYDGKTAILATPHSAWKKKK